MLEYLRDWNRDPGINRLFISLIRFAVVSGLRLTEKSKSNDSNPVGCKLMVICFPVVDLANLPYPPVRLSNEAIWLLNF